jgi:hypothetical protein
MMRIALYLSALALAACSVDPGSDRAGALAGGIAINSVRFLPIGSAYVLKDSATPVAFLGYHAGYLCSRFLKLGLQLAPGGLTLTYRPDTQVRLPASDECALDSGSRDTIATHVFSEGAIISLVNTLGEVTDAATLVSGKMGTDSLLFYPDSGGTFSMGNFTYLDSVSPGVGELRDSLLPPCRYLNSADREQIKGDTVLIRFSWVDFDPTGEGSCSGEPHFDSTKVMPHLALRMAVPGTAK